MRDNVVISPFCGKKKKKKECLGRISHIFFSIFFFFFIFHYSIPPFPLLVFSAKPNHAPMSHPPLLLQPHLSFSVLSPSLSCFLSLYPSTISISLLHGCQFRSEQPVAVNEYVPGHDDHKILKELGPRPLAVKRRCLWQRECVWPSVFTAVKRRSPATVDDNS